MLRSRWLAPSALLIVLTSTSFAQAPPGYYNGVDASTPSSLRQTLHAVIDDHTAYPYTSSSTDTWDILELADEDPNDAGRILDVYKNASYPKQGGGNSFYDREHSWPKSYGFPNDTAVTYPFTDCHLLFLCDSGYNAARGNKPFRFCDPGCDTFPTDANGGQGGPGGGYPGNANWTSGFLTAGTWETWIGRRGDVARAVLYADVRYEGGQHGVTFDAEPDLILTDNEALIAASNTGSNESIAYMGMRQAILAWHHQDPVDAREIARNDVIYSFQGNRNPFIDHPEWVDCIFGASCGVDTTPPAPPTALAAIGGNASVSLDWADNTEIDVAGYNVHRSTGGAFMVVNGSLVTASSYVDLAVTNGVSYTYEVTALDSSANESAPSGSASATPQSGGNPGGMPWINEFHYDNSGSDVGEFVEIAGPAGTNLQGFVVVGYNGNGGGVYDSVNLSGTIPAQQAQIGTLAFAFNGIQNGSPDGLALVDAGGAVIEFLSYEGGMTAVGGVANGMTSTDVGVEETTSTPVGFSLQRAGTGSGPNDFTWQPPAAETPGQPNTGQVFTNGSDVTPPGAPTGLIATPRTGIVDLDWADGSEPDLAGYSVYRATTTGGPYSKLNGMLIGSSQFNDGSVVNGVAYHYVVTATDSSMNESTFSAETSATPVLCQTDLGFGNHPTAALAACGGDLSTGHPGTMTLTGLPPGTVPFLVIGLQSLPTPVFELDGATLVPVPILFLIALPNLGTGTLVLPIPAGKGPVSVYAQYVLSAPAGFATSNALRIDLLP